MLKTWLRRWLWSNGYAVFNTRSEACYARDGLFTANLDRFRRDPDFQAAYARGVQAAGGFDPRIEWRVHVALWAAARAACLPGDFVECGVNAGFVSSAIMRRLDWANRDKTFFLFDTFSGPVLDQYSDEEARNGRLRIAQDAITSGAYVTDIERIRANFKEWPNVRIVPGVVPEILPSAGVERIAFLHLDMNCAYPERAALEFFWNHLSPGALVLLDDYAYFGNDSLAESIDAAAKLLRTEVLALPTGQGVILR